MGIGIGIGDSMEQSRKNSGDIEVSFHSVIMSITALIKYIANVGCPENNIYQSQQYSNEFSLKSHTKIS